MPKNAYLDPPVFVLANSKCVVPVTVLYTAALQVSESDYMNCGWYSVCCRHILILPSRLFKGVIFEFVTQMIKYRSTDIRVGQFKVCSTCDFVVQSHVISFGVRFHELLVARRLPHPYIELAIRAYLGKFWEFIWIFCPKMPILARRYPFWLIQSV